LMIKRFVCKLILSVYQLFNHLNLIQKLADDHHWRAVFMVLRGSTLFIYKDKIASTEVVTYLSIEFKLKKL